MTYKEALDYIHSVNWTFCKLGLERVTALCEALGNPQNDLRFVHVAGTNGKGSFCAMTASILQAAGYRTGLFTSPYIKVFNERMQVDGEMISDEELTELTAFVRPVADAMTDKPTEFELITAIAFLYFKRHHCDVVVLETGMGGRLDATNLIRHPLLSVITGIALDHTAFLGDTIAQIAAEKAGIIKDHCPVLWGGENAAAADVIAATAQVKKAPYHWVDRTSLRVLSADLEGTHFSYGDYDDLTLSLLGLYQPYNAATVLTAVELLKEQGLTISPDAVREGLASVYWPGRFEVLSRQPLIIFDGAHNAEGIGAAVESIRHYFADQKVYVLTGVLQDKDYHTIAHSLAQVASRAFVLTPENPRALAGDTYAALLEGLGVAAKAYGSIESAYAAARAAAQTDGAPLLCLGSLYTYASL
ncbi:MAG: bifunctional folylpolyglutamate synthase/dihydrofolate synthase [Clostridia bacterium]|nr:bifunctional folylpolyglutamate synthase/dihydrofolate synthase [Clostridia bacterium]